MKCIVSDGERKDTKLLLLEKPRGPDGGECSFILFSTGHFKYNAVHFLVSWEEKLLQKTHSRYDADADVFLVGKIGLW